ncbi:MAG: TlpA family protein disulfide reductase [Bacteroidetes bacterium]|nr:MAG: TlpA family protein disulfide reductase [Bacteroidota bacterium]
MNNPLSFSWRNDHRAWPGLIGLLLLLGACQPALGPVPEGPWQGKLHLQPGVVLPFAFELREGRLTLINGEERLPGDSLRIVGDSVFVRLGVFDSEFRVRRLASGQWQGHWYDYNRKDNYRIPFEARVGEYIPPMAMVPEEAALAPRWAVDFSPATDHHYPAIGIFETGERGRLTGTFLTETGDYRYLQGHYTVDSLWLTTFDGSHAFYFAARRAGDSLQGVFLSGIHWEEPWLAVADPAARLRGPDSLTFLKPGYERVAFTFPDAEGQAVSLSDPRFAGKVVIVQLLGTWCPNCMDETKLLAQWHRRYRDQGLEVVGLAFEAGGDADLAWTRIARVQEALAVDYPILLAATVTDKDTAAARLPMLNQVMSYPTTIFIDRTGKVRRIHTGFSGPGTGAAYERFVQKYEALIEAWLGEYMRCLEGCTVSPTLAGGYICDAVGGWNDGFHPQSMSPR